MKKILLISQIEQELTQIQVMVALDGADARKDKDYLGTIALNLQSFYTAVERILIVIAKEIGAVIPKAENWHQALLNQMAVELPGVRQSALGIQTQQGLDEFLRFRHVVRSNYAHQLDPERVKVLAKKLNVVSYHFIQDCKQFCAGLQPPEQQQQ